MANTGIYMKLFVAGFFLFLVPSSFCGNARLLREYIGAEGKNVKFSDVPINPEVEIHFILSFAIDYTDSMDSPSPTNGKFNVFWDKENLGPRAVKDIKSKHKNVKVALSLGGDTVGNIPAQFKPSSVSSWVSNAVSSLAQIIEEYNLDGVDIDYEHFKADANTFAECIGKLIMELKQRKLICLASIAPFEDEGEVQSHYLALWRKYGGLIDYVNFQFYAYDRSTTVKDFLEYYDIQAATYSGGKVLASFATDPAGEGLKPENGFFDAAETLKKNGKLEGIFIWSADDSKKDKFKYEKNLWRSWPPSNK